MNELESKIENDVLFLKRKIKSALLELFLLIPSLVILYLARESIKDSFLNYPLILIFLYFVVRSIRNLIMIKNGTPLLELNKIVGIVLYEGEKIGEIIEIDDVIFEEKIDKNSDGNDESYNIRLEFSDKRTLMIYNSRNKNEQRGISYIIAEFLEKRCVELNNEERIIRKDKRRYKRLVADFEEKFKEKSIEELNNILENKDKMARYAIEATHNLLNRK